MIYNLIAIEVLMINLFTTHLCSRKKYTNFQTILGLFLSFIVIHFFVFQLPSKLDQGVTAVLRGFLYLIPLMLLYQENFNRIISVMLFSFMHSLLVNAVSVSLVHGMLGYVDVGLVVIVQSGIFLISTYFVVRFIRGQFITILQGIPIRLERLLIGLGMILFFCVLWIRFLLLDQMSPRAGLLTIALLTAMITLFYWLLYLIVEDSKSISALRKLAYSDNLTGANNRLSLFLDVDKLIDRKELFYLIYMDLDDFKSVNDRFGHDEGDRYLTSFSKATIDTIHESGQFYRMSGDEFVCTYRGGNIEEFIETFEARIHASFENQIPFLGVSIGYAQYPKDCDCTESLIKKADTVMYHTKKRKMMKATS
jgi:diguanylate cyclase (GGDEF)-like protein